MVAGSNHACAAEALPPSTWWHSTGWFSGESTAKDASIERISDTSQLINSAPLQSGATACATSAPMREEATPAGVPTGVAVGGSQAQNRFTSQGMQPLFRSVPKDGAPEIAFSQSAKAAPAPFGGSALQSNSTKWASSSATTGRTCDGSAPLQESWRQHQSRWFFNLDTWAWQPCGEGSSAEALQQQDKHTLAARKWGDGRDSLYPALQEPAYGDTATTAMAAAGTPAAGAAAAAAGKRYIRVVRAKRPGGFPDLGGLHLAKKQLLDSVVLPMRFSTAWRRLGLKGLPGVLLHGPPGSGKTSLALALAAESGASLVVVNSAEVVGGPEAEQKLQDAFSSAAAQQPSVLLLEDVDVMAPSRDCSPSMSDLQQQATNRLTSLIDSHRLSSPQVVVVATALSPGWVSARLRRAGRLDVEVGLGQLGEREREEVLQRVSRAMPLAPDVDLRVVAQRLQGFVAADCAAVVTEAAMACLREAVDTLDEQLVSNRQEAEQQLLQCMVVRQGHFMEAAEQVHVPCSLRGWTVEVPNVRWEDVAGLEEAKAQLIEMLSLPLQHADKMAKYGVRQTGGALLYGPPGCGKTLLAMAAARQCGANFISVSPPDLLDKWLGQTEARVRELFQQARAAAPCVLFFDEMDALARARGGVAGGVAAMDGGNGACARLLNQLLVEMDGLQGRQGVFILGATNRMDVIDPAMLRPGRLDYLIYVGLPDREARLSMLRAKLSRVEPGPGVDLQQLAADTGGMSAAEVSELCRSALMAVLRQAVLAEQQGLSPEQVQHQGLDTLQAAQLQAAWQQQCSALSSRWLAAAPAWVGSSGGDGGQVGMGEVETDVCMPEVAVCEPEMDVCRPEMDVREMDEMDVPSGHIALADGGTVGAAAASTDDNAGAAGTADAAGTAGADGTASAVGQNAGPSSSSPSPLPGSSGHPKPATAGEAVRGLGSQQLGLQGWRSQGRDPPGRGVTQLGSQGTSEIAGWWGRAKQPQWQQQGHGQAGLLSQAGALIRQQQARIAELEALLAAAGQGAAWQQRQRQDQLQQQQGQGQ